MGQGGKGTKQGGSLGPPGWAGVLVSASRGTPVQSLISFHLGSDLSLQQSPSIRVLPSLTGTSMGPTNNAGLGADPDWRTRIDRWGPGTRTKVHM